MNDFVLIDPPVTPYSPMSELLAWVDVCRAALEEDPGSPEWRPTCPIRRRTVLRLVLSR